MDIEPIKPQIIRCTAILEKGGITAAIGIYSCTDHLHAVANFEPRAAADNQVYRRSFETRTKAVREFNQALAVSRDRGWTVIYNGEPNFG